MSSYLSRGILRIQYASNLLLHQNTFKENKALIKPTGEILALCGNIGQPYCSKTADFIKWADETFGHIFWIPGNLEYSAPSNNLATWNERADQYYESIRNWSLNNTVFCQKLIYSVPYTNITIIASPIGIQSDITRQIYVWCSKNKYRRIDTKDHALFFLNELTWLDSKLSKLTGPKLLLSNIPVYDRTITNIYGVAINGEAKTNSGGMPWSAVNMAGHAGYRKEAMMEWVEKNKPIANTSDANTPMY